jgi:cytochrome c-type biogenesis protein
MAIAVRTNYTRVSLVLVISVLIASLWLVFPYFIQGKQLLRGAGDGARLTKAGNVSMYLTRKLVNTRDLELTATFATGEFFQYVDRPTTIGNLRPDRNFIFFVGENIHEGTLDFDLPEVTLHVGNQIYSPEFLSGPRIAEHHRVTVYSFSKQDAEGNEIDIGSPGRIHLYVSNRYLGRSENLTFIGAWEAPYSLPDELKSRADITPVVMLALGAGLLSSVLTPCLLQLVVVFGSILGGFATIPGASVPTLQTNTLLRRKIIFVALAFVFGFTLLYVLAGALIGAVGHGAQLMFAEYSRTVAVVSGAIVILMGLWVGIRGVRNANCHLVDRQAMKMDTARDIGSAMLVSMGYALGCTACFGGAIVATLVIYVGAIGSAAIGAGIMATFSIGVAIPFLLSAWYVSRMDSVLQFVTDKARIVSYVSMVLIITFGLILITDNFHTVSDAIYPYLGLH